MTIAASTTSVLSAREIIEGAFSAMEQAGNLVNDALLLYDQKRWASSLVLGVFAMEELGKAEMLLQRGIEADSGPKKPEQVVAGFRGHERKLRAGRGPITVIAPVFSWGDLPDPKSDERKELEERLEQAQKIALENAPSQDHAARMKALYVDLLPNGVWSTPKEIQQGEAYVLVSAASIEYDVRRRKFVNPADDVVKRAVKELGNRIPTLPAAPSVSWPKP